MRQWLVEEPTGDSVLLRHPSGRPCEIKVVAGSRAGSTFVARWSLGGVFDEAPRMIGEGDGVVNLDQARDAIYGRVLKGCSLLYIGSPWAPRGPVYHWTQEGFGRPSRARVVVRAPGPLMNPFYFTPAFCEDMRINNPRAYITDVLADFADADEAFFDTPLIEAAFRGRSSIPIPPEPLRHYVAAMDPATRTNAWTFGISTVDADGLRTRHTVVLAKQWLGNVRDRVRPQAILGEIAAICAEYNVHEVHTDQYSPEVLADIAESAGRMIVWRGVSRRLHV